MTARDAPSLSILVTTRDRPHLLPRAIASALAQTTDDVEVLVVDDGSSTPAEVPAQPRLRLLRLPENRGLAAARNAGAAAARGRYVTHLDDDDELLPHFATVSLDALASATLPSPVAVVSGLATVNARGAVVETHLPPTLVRGAYFGLDPIAAGLSYFSKQTLVVERELLRSIGGFDEALGALPYTELFLRLSPACSILGVPVVTYRQTLHDGPRLSRDPSRRRADYAHLVARHAALLGARPRLHATLALRQARALWAFGDRGGTLACLTEVLRRDPLYGAMHLPRLVLRAALGGRRLKRAAAPRARA